jgi:hypothetical protein
MEKVTNGPLSSERIPQRFIDTPQFSDVAIDSTVTT